MMNPSFQRATLLPHQRRYSDAERELRQTLEVDPNCTEVHPLLAEALLDQDRSDEATEEAAIAITQDPGLELGHPVACCASRRRGSA